MRETPNHSFRALTDVEEYETLVAAIPGGILVATPDPMLTILFANPGFYDLVGYEQEEYTALFQNMGTQVLHPDDAPKVLESARVQLKRSGKFDIKGRLRHKSKNMGYIFAQFHGRLHRSSDGSIRVYIVVADISEQQAALENLEKEKAFNEMIASLSEEAYFDCDLVTGRTRYSGNFSQKLGFQGDLSSQEDFFEKMGLPSPDKLWEQKKLLFHAQNDRLEEELHFKLPSGETVWYRYRCRAVKNQEGVPVRLVGKLIDITQHKIQIGALSELVQKDQLTGLLNKTATENMIKEALKMRRAHDELYALMIIDIDNFKNVNDRLGHLYGDAVLTQLAEYLRRLFRADDIVGRVGGDEFFVFLKNCYSPEMLRTKAADICTLFHKTYSVGDTFVTISASVGIALCPEQGIHFDTLYQNADGALYSVKAQGKNSYAFFSENLAQTYLSERTKIDSNISQKSFRDNRIEYVFRLLYDSENPVRSIQAVLQLVAESYGFSRGYIFETSPDGIYTSNTFEWCTKEISAEIHSLQDIPLASITSAVEAFEKDGMFLVKDVRKLPEIEQRILEPQGIRSMFQFGIQNRGKLAGFIGFDDCLTERVPTDAEIDEICTVCHVLATFLLKHRSNERESRHYQSIESVIDHINSYAYVIDADHYTVLYENQQVVTLIGSSSIGKKCHLAYRSSPTPCKNCPMVYLHDNDSRHTEEIFNEKCCIHLHVEACQIDWYETRKACLFYGIDITEYKTAQLAEPDQIAEES